MWFEQFSNILINCTKSNIFCKTCRFFTNDMHPLCFEVIGFATGESVWDWPIRTVTGYCQVLKWEACLSQVILDKQSLLCSKHFHFSEGILFHFVSLGHQAGMGSDTINTIRVFCVCVCRWRQHDYISLKYAPHGWKNKGILYSIHLRFVTISVQYVFGIVDGKQMREISLCCWDTSLKSTGFLQGFSIWVKVWVTF